MTPNSGDALELCRRLLAYSAPGSAIPVPHMALAQVVELACGTFPDGMLGARESLDELYDVAALAKRYDRSTATVRGWFAAGLFGPPADRLFRGRGYVATAAAVREFEARGGAKDDAGRGAPAIREVRQTVRPPKRHAPPTPTIPRSAPRLADVGSKIRAASGAPQNR